MEVHSPLDVEGMEACWQMSVPVWGNSSLPGCPLDGHTCIYIYNNTVFEGFCGASGERMVGWVVCVGGAFQVWKVKGVNECR